MEANRSVQKTAEKECKLCFTNDEILESYFATFNRLQNPGMLFSILCEAVGYA